jgi:hypothetical protein
MDIIAISGKARSGKDTIGKKLKEQLEELGEKVIITHYGDFLKFICTQWYGWDGQKDEKGRSILQNVGQSFRNNDEDVWVNMMVNFLRGLGDSVDTVIIPDCRYPNELIGVAPCADTIFTIRIDRKGFKNDLTDAQKLHPSEVSLDNYPFDLYVMNDSDEEHYLNKADEIIRYLNVKRKKIPLCI